MGVRHTLPILALVLAVPALGDDESESCDIFPPDISIYSGWSGCALKRLNQPALWQGLPKDAVQVTRLTFTDGHVYFFRSVTITRHADGKGVLTVLGTSRPGPARPTMPPVVNRKVKLNADDLIRLDQLADQAGVFDFERGSWDGEELYMHCQTLDIERVTAQGYRVSVVNIGCNQPAKLMPFVREVVRLAKMKNGGNGQLFYWAERPPSTTGSRPVVKAARSLARNTTASATFCDSPR